MDILIEIVLIFAVACIVLACIALNAIIGGLVKLVIKMSKVIVGKHIDSNTSI